MKKILILMIALCFSAAPRVWAADEKSEGKVELALGYNYLHANAPPGGCGCFSLNGAQSELGLNFTNKWSGVIDFSWADNGNVDGSGKDLLLGSYLGGVRYKPAYVKHGMHPFAEVELGNTNARGSASPAALGVGHNNVFSFLTGGGVDLPLSKHFEWRIVDVDYLLTLFHNSSNDHQNNVRVTTALVYRFGRR